MNATAFAPAKINLSLKVGRPRPDGLHPLQSVVVFADVGDHVTAEAAPELSLRVDGPFASALTDESDNLVLRAARALAGAAEVSTGAALTLDKQLPIASGIGGGSSDAAATLTVLNQFWELDWEEARLVEIACTLGADVPVCLAAQPAYVTGIGERVAPIDVPELAAVLVNPGVPLATADVYRAFDRAALGVVLPDQPAPRWRDAGAALAGVAAIGNDLAAPARSLTPAIMEVERVLRADPRTRVAQLSGSGATVFALVDNMDAAASLAADIAARYVNWWVRAARLA